MRRYEVLEKLIKQHGWTKGAEIGVFKGTTFFYLLDNCPELNLIGIDSWHASPQPHQKDIHKGLSSWKSPEEMNRYCREVVAKVERYEPRGEVWITDSASPPEHVDDGTLDFVFIDADHSEQSVLADVRAWAPKVRKGGWILGHDEQWPSVRRALTKLFDGWTVHQDNVWSVP